ncbi:MAG: hypothetical protein OXC31_01650 [Spirochaetaceae bacterium]|nr:hypothetical protein [Spirochaetaceae bacterium]
MAAPEFPEWVEQLPPDERTRMRDHLDRQRRAATVAPHAELRAVERRLREAAAADPDPDRRRVLTRAADYTARAAAELVTLAELLANPEPPK